MATTLLEPSDFESGGARKMPKALKLLLDIARNVSMTPEEREQQRRSFAYGNTKIENERITRATIDRAAEALEEEDPE